MYILDPRQPVPFTTYDSMTQTRRFQSIIVKLFISSNMGLIFSAMVIASVYQHKVRKPHGPFVFISIKSRFCPPQNRTFCHFQVERMIEIYFS